jgi:hypothetical protein
MAALLALLLTIAPAHGRTGDPRAATLNTSAPHLAFISWRDFLLWVRRGEQTPAPKKKPRR